ncbi:hypothetical protein J6590_070567 [Homalodisca vitripennis]|nr:hypothetical protein J6590_070567 [Homalodisca vitripennis]
MSSIYPLVGNVNLRSEVAWCSSELAFLRKRATSAIYHKALALYNRKGLARKKLCTDIDSVQDCARLQKLVAKNAISPLGGLRDDQGLKMVHERRWRLHPVLRISLMVLQSPSPRVASDLLSLSTLVSSVVMGVITGHGHLRKHLQILSILWKDPLCRMCDEQEESAEHLLPHRRGRRRRM